MTRAYKASLAALGLVLFLSAAAFGQDAAPLSGDTAKAADYSDFDAGVGDADTVSGREMLIQAYKKEFAFLENEKRSLQSRLREIDIERSGRVGRLQGEINQMEGELLFLSSQVQNADEELRKLQQKASDFAETEEALSAMTYQARTTLDKHGVDLPEFDEDKDEPMKKEIDHVFFEAAKVLGELSSIRKEKGSFFLADGTRVDGEIVKVGEVASLGISAKGSGTLAPAGAGHLQLWDPNTGDAARALAEGRSPAVLPLYLYESLEKMAEHAAEKTWRDTLEDGGLIGYVIVALGCLAALMLLLRVLFLLRSATNTGRLVDQVSPLIQKGEKAKALDICKPQKGAAARVLAATIRNIDADPEHLEDIISESILHETPYLDRFESAIMVFAAVSPLLGLLGTVTGMIATFDIITQFGTGDPKLLSGGISEALVTTQLGLMVAIPTLLLGHMLSGWAERIKDGMENAALRITNIAKGYKPPEQGKA